MALITRRRQRLLAVIFCLLLSTTNRLHGDGLATHAARGSHGAVASVQPLATEAGLRALQHGGNAVDAAIATAVTLGVVDGHNSGLGGGCFILIRSPEGTLSAIDGREMAPAAASRDMYLRDGQADAQLSQTGPLAIAVPGAVAAYELAARTHGRLALADALNRAADLAVAGFPIDRVMARNIRDHRAEIARYPATAAVLLHADGTPLVEGERMVQADLASTYRLLAEYGSDALYRGPLGATIARWLAEHGGLLSVADFENYRTVEREPIVTTYRGYKIVGFPPPSSGGIHVAQILNILESFELREIHRRDPALLVHIVAEAMKLAFADRAYWLGDSDFVAVPRGLIDKNYAKQLAQRIQFDRVSLIEQAGTPVDPATNVFRKHTTHIAAVDAEGWWVAITATVNTSFGSKVVVPGTGMFLNNQMDDFSAQPGQPNAFGLIGSEKNEIAPGKRPLSSMSPTLVLLDQQPVAAIGAAGGPKIISQVVLTIVGLIDLQMPLDESIARPRWHQQWRPDRLFVERTLPAAVKQRLVQLGHQLEESEFVGVTQAVGRTADGALWAVHDPRVPGKALAY